MIHTLASRDDDIELAFFDLDGTEFIIDNYGIFGQDNTATGAEFEDGRAERLGTVRAPAMIWDINEWNITADDASFVLPGPNYDPGKAGPSGHCLKAQSGGADMTIASRMAQSRVLGWKGFPGYGRYMLSSSSPTISTPTNASNASNAKFSTPFTSISTTFATSTSSFSSSRFLFQPG